MSTHDKKHGQQKKKQGEPNGGKTNIKSRADIRTVLAGVLLIVGLLAIVGVIYVFVFMG